ncbi:hypothetical protein NDU88_000915 [Pleurodeles waltl]|uniref:Uncharacterized protein n=1 Tax=Pleurodeles waltl TaxID=8319 RepID=A0AAV7WGW3_PLEWA|nr:hypothetical protein NDU88_000915 [Pleurodeles waltl]
MDRRVLQAMQLLREEGRLNAGSDQHGERSGGRCRAMLPTPQVWRAGGERGRGGGSGAPARGVLEGVVRRPRPLGRRQLRIRPEPRAGWGRTRPWLR